MSWEGRGVLRGRMGRIQMSLNRGHHWEEKKGLLFRHCFHIPLKWFFHFYFPSWWKYCYFYTVTEQMELWLRDHNVYDCFDVLLTVLSHFWQVPFFFFSPGMSGVGRQSPQIFCFCSGLCSGVKPCWGSGKLLRGQPQTLGNPKS